MLLGNARRDPVDEIGTSQTEESGMSVRQFVGAVATLLLIIGLAGVVWPITVDGPRGDPLSCADGGISPSVPVVAVGPDRFLTYDDSGQLVGSTGYQPAGTGEVFRAEPWDANCATALTVRTVWAATALVISGVVLLGVLLIQPKPEVASS